MAKNTGKVREFCQSGKVGTLFGFWKSRGITVNSSEAILQNFFSVSSGNN